MTARRPLAPYDTGARLEPQPWPINDDSDRIGRIDFDDGEGATVLTAYAERPADGRCVMHVELIAGEGTLLVTVDGAPYTSVKGPRGDSQENR